MAKTPQVPALPGMTPLGIKPRAQIVRIFVRTYSDSGETRAFVEWRGSSGKPATTSGPAENRDGEWHFSAHMTALIERGLREGLSLESEVW